MKNFLVVNVPDDSCKMYELPFSFLKYKIVKGQFVSETNKQK